MRILMLGNSLTTSCDLPQMVARALDADVVVHARGGARLAEHLNPKTKLGAKMQAAMLRDRWDYVVLQEMSNGPVRCRERFLESVAALCELVRANGAEPLLYATWAYAPACPKLAKLGLSHDQMHERMRSAFAVAAEDNRLPVAWACDAFFTSPDRQVLYASDGVHPSEAGATVAARAIADAIGQHAQSRPASAGSNEGVGRPYFVYIMRCEDGSLYTGITTDVARRLKEHRSRGTKAARYTRTHPIVSLEASWEVPDRASASRLEYRIKRLSHDEKLHLVADPNAIDALV